MTVKNLSKTLLKAAELLDLHGLHQGYYFSDYKIGDSLKWDGEASMCAYGSIIAATEAEGENLCECDIKVVEEVALERMSPADRTEVLHNGNAIVPAYNDSPNRTKQEVVDLLRAAAERAHERGL